MDVKRNTPIIGRDYCNTWFFSCINSTIALRLAEAAREQGISVDPLKAAAIALVHDIPEAFIGDLVPAVSKRIPSLKESLEIEAIEEKIYSNIIRSLYTEYVERKNTESKIAKLADLISTYSRCLVYENMDCQVNDIKINTIKQIRKYTSELGLSDIVNKLFSTIKTLIS